MSTISSTHKEIRVSTLNWRWEKVYQFSSWDAIQDIQIEDFRAFIQNECEYFEQHEIAFIYENEILPLDIKTFYDIPAVKSNGDTDHIHLDVFVIGQPVLNSGNNQECSDEDCSFSSFVVDPLSIGAAQEWAQSVDKNAKPDALNIVGIQKYVNAVAAYQQYLQRHETDATVDVTHNVGNEHPVAPAAQIQWFQLELIGKMVLLYFVFNYNRRTGILEVRIQTVALLIVGYLFLVGALKHWWNYLVARMRPRATNPPPQLEQAAVREPAEGGALGLYHRAVASAESFYRHLVTIPTEPGLLNDLQAVVQGVVCSLHPRWVPTAGALRNDQPLDLAP